MAFDVGIVFLTLVLGILVIGLCWTLTRKPRSDTVKGAYGAYFAQYCFISSFVYIIR